MKRICGLSMFWIGVGMAVRVLFPRSILLVIVAILFIIVGYQMFCG